MKRPRHEACCSGHLIHSQSSFCFHAVYDSRKCLQLYTHTCTAPRHGEEDEGVVREVHGAAAALGDLLVDVVVRDGEVLGRPVLRPHPDQQELKRNKQSSITA
jgi:hypothetical protein